MPRHPEGWKLWLDRTGIYQVRFTHAGRRQSYTTGEREQTAAAAEASRIYSNIVAGRPARLPAAPEPGTALAPLVATWLETVAAEYDAGTISLFRCHWRRLARFFRGLDRIVDPVVADYCRERLRSVLKESLKHELTSLRAFVRWCFDNGYLREIPKIAIPNSRRATGTPDTKRRHKRKPVELTEPEAYAVITRLPERASRKPWYPVRDRFVVQWETALRGETMDQLACPEHYRPGQNTLTITDPIDKVRYGRELPLTETAQAALTRWARRGVIFGRHDYRPHLKRATEEAAEAKELPREKVGRVSPKDFRHGRLTSLGEHTKSLAGLAYIAGHLQLTTTSRYVHPSKRAAEAVLEDYAEKRTRAPIPAIRQDTGRVCVGVGWLRTTVTLPNSSTFTKSCEGGDLNPYGNNPASTSRVYMCVSARNCCRGISVLRSLRSDSGWYCQ